MKTDIKFAVGQRNGLKSSIWTINIKRNDIYVSAGILTNETKVSIHESSESQWSYRSEVWKNKGQPNQARHIVKWQSQIPTNSKAVNIFKIKIPQTELTNYSAVDIKKGVKWINGLIRGTYQFDLCLTSLSATDPTLNTNDLPHQVLGTLQLADKRWLVVFYQATNEISVPKNDIIKDIGSKGVDLTNAGAMCLFGTSDDGVPVMIEAAL